MSGDEPPTLRRREVSNSSRLDTSTPKLEILVDRNKPTADTVEEMLLPFKSANPNLIAVVGGDGFMLDMIRKNAHRGIPIIGLNVGHEGFLNNEPTILERGFPLELVCYELPLLDVVIITAEGEEITGTAFNDAWIERSTGQTGWIKVDVTDGNWSGSVAKVVADGMLTSTPAGSTAYAMSMGATPVPLGSDVLVLVASNVHPIRSRFDPKQLPLDAKITFTVLDPVKRPMQAFLDGESQGNVLSMEISVNPEKIVKVAYHEEFDLGRKLMKIQFSET